jgi:peptidoglycan/xylan/chitin deacetylase (PgdA/CDA1 family)
MQAHGIAFHHFHDGPLGGPNVAYPAGAGSLSAQELADLIERIDPRRILPAHVFLNRVIHGQLQPQDVCLTFDDTLRCQYDLAVPVLEDFGLTAFWFVNSSVLQGNIERLEVYRQFRTIGFHTLDDFYAAFFVALNETEFAEADRDVRFRHVRDCVLGPTRYAAVMDRMMEDAGFNVRRVARQLWMDDSAVVSLHESGHVIGLHSHTHPTQMAMLDAAEQQYEYRSNFNHLTALLGEPPTAMAHPCNSYNAYTLRLLRGLGIKLGFGAGGADTTGGLLEMPRIDGYRRPAQRIAA